MTEDQRDDEANEAAAALPDAKGPEVSGDAAASDTGPVAGADPVSAQGPGTDPAESPVAEPAKSSVEGPRKILEALEDQSEAEEPIREEIAAPVSESGEGPEGEEIPAVSAEEGHHKDDEVLITQTAEPSEKPPEALVDDPDAVEHDSRPLDPENLISEAMKKLDRLLEAIKSDSVISGVSDEATASF